MGISWTKSRNCLHLLRSEPVIMASSASFTPSSSSFLVTRYPTVMHRSQHVHVPSLFQVAQPYNRRTSRIPHGRSSLMIVKAAAKLPAGVELPKAQPKFQAPFLGFTRTAETWNSRACMIGLIGTFIVELILNKGILQLIGVEIGKGLDIPL